MIKYILKNPEDYINNFTKTHITKKVLLTIIISETLYPVHNQNNAIKYMPMLYYKILSKIRKKYEYQIEKILIRVSQLLIQQWTKSFHTVKKQ